jgi:hypothetical protein
MTTPLLTRAGLAAVLAIGTRTLDRRRAANEVLDPLPGSGQPRWNPDEVTAWVAAGRPSAATWGCIRPKVFRYGK